MLPREKNHFLIATRADQSNLSVRLLGLNFRRKNGAKIDGIIYKIYLSFKLIYIRKRVLKEVTCFLSSQVNSYFYLNIRLNVVSGVLVSTEIYTLFYDSEAISGYFKNYFMQSNMQVYILLKQTFVSQ